MLRLFGITLTLFLIPLPIAAETPAPAEKWEDHIRRFERSDADAMPKHNGILFVGSSSIVKWKTDKWFPDDQVINRGFGGSQISDVNYYLPRVVLKYRPRLIVFYCGDNDIARGKPPERVHGDFKRFASVVRDKLPATHVVYIPIKPSPARWKLWPMMRDANTRIEQTIRQHDTLHVADIAAPMLGEDGKPRAELFASDGLHLNEKGYQLWTST